MDINQEIKLIEKELLEIIIQNLQSNKITLEEAKALARDFLATLPVKDQEDLLAKLKTIGQLHQEAQGIYVNEITKITNQKRDIALTKMRQAIHNGDMASAIQIAKSY